MNVVLHLLGDMCTGQGGQGKGDPGEAKGSKGGVPTTNASTS